MTVVNFLFLSSLSFASGDIVTLKKGQHAPFSGTLFSKDAAATLTVRLENSEKRCNLKIKEALERQKVINQYDIKILKIQNDEQKKRCDAIINIKNDSIDALRKKAISDGKSWKNSLWFGGGVLTGIGITAISAWSLSKIPTAK